jgi:hypothetical protein
MAAPSGVHCAVRGSSSVEVERWVSEEKRGCVRVRGGVGIAAGRNLENLVIVSFTVITPISFLTIVFLR